MTRIAPML